MNGKISAIIPAYNIQEYLGPTLDSVLAQTYENLEIIVVNDGSRDDTGAVADAYAAKDSRIRVIHKENGGVTSARLRGVSEATGDFIGFVDGDDFIEPHMYALLMGNMQAYGADISHCGYQMVFPSRVDYYYNTGRVVSQEGEQGCTDLLNGRFVEPGLGNKLYRRELFAGLADWMDTSIHINEDLLMNFYLFRQVKKAVFEDVCPYHYVLRKGSATTSRLNEHKLYDPVRVMHILLEETANWLHGEIVGLGCQAEMYAFERSEYETKNFARFMEAIGQPMTLRDLGINPTDENLKKLVDCMMVVWGKRPAEHWQVIYDSLRRIK